MIPCHSAALRCTWPFAVTCMTPSSIENEIAHLTVAAFSSHLSRLRREERLVMTAYAGDAGGAVPALPRRASLLVRQGLQRLCPVSGGGRALLRYWRRRRAHR